MYDKVNIESYVNTESSIPKRNGLLSFWWLMLIVSIPSAVFGVYADITKIAILPLVAILSFWIIYLLVNADSKKMNYILFLGVFSIFISISFLIAAYKIAVIEINVSGNYVLLIIFVYFLSIILGILNTFRLIRKGYYKKQRKIENPIGMIFASGLFGLGIGRLLLAKISQDIVVAVLVIGLIFLGFLFSMGTHNLLKYYLAKKHKCAL